VSSTLSPHTRRQRLGASAQPYDRYLALLFALLLADRYSEGLHEALLFLGGAPLH
jgi:hypothetical protein